MRRLFGILIVFLTMIGCKGTKDAAVTNISQPETAATTAVAGRHNSSLLPQAVAYKTNGNYNDNVPIMLNSEHTALIAFPGPTDVSATGSTPIELGDGWLLDRRGGIGKNTAFLKYTYKEYAALKSLPTMAELMQSIIPGAEVTEVKVLPIKLSQALENPELARKYLAEE